MAPQHIIKTPYFPALAYRRFGSGPAVMLIHGFPASGSLWRETALHLSQSCTVLLPDLPGTGDSTLEGEAITIEELASIMPAILDDAGIARCIAAGHSMGGYIALAAAGLYADRLDGLSLVHSTALADNEERKEKRRKTIALLRNGGKAEFIRGMIPALFSEAFKHAHPEVIQERIEDGMKQPVETMIAFYQAMMDRPERLDILRRASFPVQWILGAEDSTIPWQSCLQQSSLPDVSFIRLYDDCGHMGMLEQAFLMQKDLLKFVEYCVIRIEEGQLR